MADISYWFDELQKEVDGFQQQVSKLKSLIESSNMKALEMAIKDCEAKVVRLKEIKKSFGLEVRLIRDRTQRTTYEAQAAVYEDRFAGLNKEFEAARTTVNKKSLLKESATTFGSTEGKDNDTLLGDAHKVQDLTFESLARTRAMIEASKEVGAATVETLKGQREQIKEIEEEVDKIDSNLMRAELLVRNFTRRMATDRIIQAFTAFNIVVMVSLILYVAISGKALSTASGKSGGVGPGADSPTLSPTFMPTLFNSSRPSFAPSFRPTLDPTSAAPFATALPSAPPTVAPTQDPSQPPTAAPI